MFPEVSHIKKRLTEEAVLSHAEGDISVGASPLFSMGNIKNGADSLSWHVKWSAIDIDGKPGHESDTKKKTLAIYRYATNQLGLKAYVEESKSKGYHIFFFYDFPMHARRSQDLMDFIIKMSGYNGAEIFPKQHKRNLDDKVGYSNTLNLPLCGYYRLREKTIFVEPVLGDLIPYDDQVDFLSAIEKNQEEDVSDILIEVPETRDIVVKSGFRRGTQQLRFAEIDVHGGQSKCEILAKIGDSSKNDLDYMSWNTVCMCLSLFSNWESNLPDLIASTADYPKNLVDSREKISYYVNYGCKGGKCSYTSCSKVGNHNACPYQSITKCLTTTKEDAIPECPYNWVSDYHDDEFLDTLNSVLDENDKLKGMWERMEHVKASREDGEMQTHTIEDGDEISIKERQYNTGSLAFQLFQAGLSEEFVYRALPLFKHGLSSFGNEHSFWRCTYNSHKRFIKAKSKEDERIAGSSVAPYALRTIRSGKSIGIYERHTHNIKTDGGDIVEVEKFDPMTDFALDYVAKIRSSDGSVRFLYKIYPKKFLGRKYFNVVVSAREHGDTRTFKSSLDSQLLTSDVQIFKTGEATINKIVYSSREQRDAQGKVAISIDSHGYNDDVDAWFFKDFIIHGNSIIGIPENNYMMKVGEYNVWLEYLNNPIEKSLSSIPSPKMEYVNNIEKIKAIRDHLIKWWPISWGGPVKGQDALLLLGWIAANIYKKEILEEFQSFPLCYISGNFGSGKNHHALIAGMIQGFMAWNETNINSTSMPGLMRILTGHRITWIDEYRNTPQGVKMEEILKSAYTCGSSIKADLLDQHKIVHRVCRSSIFMTSESLPSIASFAERCVMLGMSMRWRSDPDNIELSEASHIALHDEELGGINFSELSTYWIKNKNEAVKSALVKTISVMRKYFIQKYNASARTALVYATCHAALATIVYSDVKDQKDLPLSIFKSLNGFIKAKILKDRKEEANEPVFPMLRNALDHFGSSLNKLGDGITYKDYPVFVHIRDVKSSSGEVIGDIKTAYVNFNLIYTWYRKSLHNMGGTEDKGKNKMLDNFKGFDGYEGIGIYPDEGAPFKGGLYKFSDESEIFRILEDIAYIIKNGQIVPYSDIIKKRKREV